MERERAFGDVICFEKDYPKTTLKSTLDGIGEGKMQLYIVVGKIAVDPKRQNKHYTRLYLRTSQLAVGMYWVAVGVVWVHAIGVE